MDLLGHPQGAHTQIKRKRIQLSVGSIPFDDRQKDDSFLRRKKWPHFPYSEMALSCYFNVIVIAEKKIQTFLGFLRNFL